MLVVLKIARFVNLLLVALLAGLLVGVAFVEVALLDCQPPYTLRYRNPSTKSSSR
jgi:hypothetical protein